MSEQLLGPKKTGRLRKLFPDLAILKATTWGHQKALWCEEGLFIFDGESLHLDEDWNGYGRMISEPRKSSTWKKEFGERFVFSPDKNLLDI